MLLKVHFRAAFFGDLISFLFFKFRNNILGSTGHISPLGMLYLYIKMYFGVADSHNAHGPGWLPESSDATSEEYIAL